MPGVPAGKSLQMDRILHPDIEDRKVLHTGEYVQRFDHEQSPARLENVLKHVRLPQNAVVADFGCGSGMLLERIHDRVAQYEGVDFSQDFIDLARRRSDERRLRNSAFHCMALQEFSRRNADRFDAVFALDISEHVPDGDWSEAVAAIRLALKPGGTAYVHTPNRDFLAEILKAHDFILRQFPEHIAVRTGHENARFFVNSGFEDVRVDLVPHYNILRFVHPLACLPVIGRYFAARIFLQARKPA